MGGGRSNEGEGMRMRDHREVIIGYSEEARRVENVLRLLVCMLVDEFISL